MEEGNMAAVLLQNDGLPCSSLEVLDSLWIPNSSPPPPPPPPPPSLSFHGSSRIVNFDKEENGNNNIEDSNYDGCYHQPEKKRRLTTDQVQFLERSFEVENKLEPERKAQLAKELGLQPRQVAIWFQNRRARYKTKQLEKEYDCLKASYDKLNADYDCLFKENQKLKNEVQLLAENLLQREKGKGKSETAEIQLNTSAFSPTNNVIGSSSAAAAAIKQEFDAASSAKSDVFDSDSPHCCTDDHNSSNLVLEVDRPSDFSQEEDDDSLSRSLIQPPPPPPYPPPSSSSCFPKLEDDDELHPNSSCHDLGFPMEEDQAVTWFWPY